MDLVSSTLDKYLKHRFNGDIKLPSNSNVHAISTPQAQSMSNGPVATDLEMSVSEATLEQMEIESISFHKLMPCCVALRHDETFIAAGFENSHIYLWHLSVAVLDSVIAKEHEHGTSKPHSQSDHKTNLKAGTKHRLLAHSGTVYSIKFIKDQDLMLSCSEDTTIRLWCLNTKCNLAIYRGHSYPVWSLAVATKDDYFATASMDATARLWRLDKMCPLRIFCGHDDDVECVEFHPNAKYVATGSADCTVRLWSIADGRSVRLMVGHTKPILSLSFLPNGKFLASAGSDGSIKLWNLESSCVVSELQSQQSPAQATFSVGPEQSFVSTCGCDNILRIWKMETDKFSKVKEQHFRSQFSEFLQAHFSRDNKLFVVGYSQSMPISHNKT